MPRGCFSPYKAKADPRGVIMIPRHRSEYDSETSQRERVCRPQQQGDEDEETRTRSKHKRTRIG